MKFKIKKFLHWFGFHFYEDVTWWVQDRSGWETEEWTGLKCCICDKVKKKSFVRLWSPEW